MRQNIKVLFAFFLTGFSVSAQPLDFLPRNINHTSKNNIYPYVSANGKTMIFLSDYSEDDELWVMESEYKAGKWQDPKEVNNIGPTRVNNIGGYALSNDGKTIWFSSKRADGLGKYDIWYLQKGKTQWSFPKNPGKPLNSDLQEGNPSISPDGQRLYFNRCQRITRELSEGCKIYYSDRNPGIGRPWKEPVPLPDYINLGNTLSPRILSDNKTLVFSSERPGGKGHLDLWMTRLEDGHWSEPTNMEFANTDINDQYIAISLRSDQAYVSRIDKFGFGAIAKIKVPEKFRPDNVIMVIGKVIDDHNTPIAVDIRISNFDTGKLFARMASSLKDGSFTLTMPEHARYEVTYSVRSGSKVFHTDFYDATSIAGSRREYPTIEMHDIRPDLELPLNSLVFQPHTSKIDARSKLELLRLSRLLRKNPELTVEIGVYQRSYLEDITQSNEDLTETRTDTTSVFEPAIETYGLANSGIDSLLSSINDTLSNTFQDTLLANAYLERMSGTMDSVEVMAITRHYHNDRSLQQALAVKDWLINKEIDPDRVRAIGYRDKQAPFDFEKGINRLVVVKFN